VSPISSIGVLATFLARSRASPSGAHDIDPVFSSQFVVDSKARSDAGQLILFPGALGDCLCAFPTFSALTASARGETLLVLNPPALELVEPPHALSMQRREVADLFATSPPAEATMALLGNHHTVHSWTGHHQPGFTERLASITGGVVHLHRFRGMSAGEHATEYYARSARVRPMSARLWTSPEIETWAHDWMCTRVGRNRHLVLLHPGSGSPRKNWGGFKALVPALRRRDRVVAVLLGPAETDDVGVWYETMTVRDLTISQVAALLRRASLYVGNDSGVSHLAAAVGTPAVVLFGPTDPSVWAPRGPATHIVYAPLSCQGCGPDRFCQDRLPPATVLDAVRQLQADRLTSMPV
jgi:heptosyltransferase-3